MYTHRMRTNNVIKATWVTLDMGELMAWRVSNSDTCIKSKQPASQKILHYKKKEKKLSILCHTMVSVMCFLGVIDVAVTIFFCNFSVNLSSLNSFYYLSQEIISIGVSLTKHKIFRQYSLHAFASIWQVFFWFWIDLIK